MHTPASERDANYHTEPFTRPAFYHAAHGDFRRFTCIPVIPGFSYPLHSTPPLGVPVRILPYRLVCKSVAIPDCEKKFEYVYNRFDRIPACDRQTNRHRATA